MEVLTGMRFRAFLFAALVAWTWPSQADAQIYAWRDANGTLVLSDRSIDAPTDGLHRLRERRAT